MAPVSTDGISSAAAFCSSACTLQVILGCVLPFIAVASTIPAMMIRRHLATRHVFQQPKAQSATPRAQPTPRLPTASVYIARLDYYLPPSNTVASQPVPESNFGESNASLTMDDSKVDLRAPSPVLIPQAPPMASLPSLSSMLCEFTAYADAIEPELLTETKRSSSCLLDSVSSSMDAKVLSFTELPTIPSLAPIQLLGTSASLEHPTCTCETIYYEEDRTDDEKACTVTTYSIKQSISPYYEEPTFVEEQDSSVEPYKSMGDNAIHGASEDNVEEISTSCLVPATTTWSIMVDSSSTLASILAVRLSQFPPVPALHVFPPMNFSAASIIAQQSESSLGSMFTRSISAPASLDILEFQLEDALPRRRVNLMDWPSFSNPGELWDEDDDMLFSVYLPQKPVDLSKPVRHTWTAGFAYNRSDQGDLWDEEDDRRFSYAGELKMIETFASSSILGVATPGNYDINDLTLSSTEPDSLADQVYEDGAISEEAADQTLCCSESDQNFDNSGFTEVTSCFDFCFTSSNEQNIKLSPSCEDVQSELWSSSPSSSLCRFAFEDLEVDAMPIYLSESSRASLMSLVSVLDSTIRLVNPIREPENLEKMFEVVDMELEPGFSYSSRIISVNYPLIREVCSF